MRPARLTAAGLALLGVAILATRAVSSRPQDATDPVLEAEFVLTGREHHSRGAAEVRVRPDGAVTVSVNTIGPQPRPPAHVEAYRLSAEELRALGALVRQVDFFGVHEPEPRSRHWGGPTLRISLDGEILERENVSGSALAPLTIWFHRFVEQTRLLRDLRKGERVREVAQALSHDSHQVARRSDFRAPLSEYAEKCSHPKELLVALGALAPLEDPAPWGALARRRAAILDADAEFTLLDGLIREAWETNGRVTEEHRATLFARALAIVRNRTREWAVLTDKQRDAVNHMVNALARGRFEPLFEALPEMARAGAGHQPIVALPLHCLGERGFDLAMELLSAPEAGVRHSVVRLMPVFLYEPRGRFEAEHPVPEDERVRVRGRLLGEGLARLDAMAEDAAEGREGRKLARGEAKWIRSRSIPKAPEPPRAPLPPGLSIEVIGEDGRPLAGVRVRGVYTSADRRPAPDERPLTATVVSDASGIALFAGLAPGNWEFDVEDAGLVRKAVTAARPFVEGMAVKLRLRVRAKQVLSGRLVGNSGRPLVGIAVQRLRADGTPHDEDAQVRTDEMGRVSLVEIPSLEPGSLLITTADGRTFTLEERYLTSGKDWVVDFGPGGDGMAEPSIRGRVVGPNGEGLPASVWVVVSGTTGPAAGASWSRADGSFEVYGLAPGAYRVSANYRGADGKSLGKGAAGSVNVETIPARDVTLTIPLGGRIAGRVLDASGTAVVGLYLLAEMRESTQAAAPAEQGIYPTPPRGQRSGLVVTDPEGRFLFENLLEGEYAFAAGPGNASWIDRAATARTGETDVTVRALPCAPLVGTVVSKSGAPLREVFVTASRLPGHDHVCHATTDQNGAFSLAGADPESPYALVVQLLAGVPPGPAGEVAAGARTARLEVGIALGSVVVKDRFGERVPRMRIVLRHAESGREVDRECDRDGAFHLPYGLAGRWTVERKVPKPGRESVLGTVESGVLDQVISLPEEWE